MAFLIPLIQRILSQPPATQRAISALIISPTRELAAQIQVEAKKLLADHAMSVGMVVGATNINADGPKLRSHILIAVCYIVMIGQKDTDRDVSDPRTSSRPRSVEPRNERIA
jgi:superfamily II DNA/RNA helicase